MQSGLSWHTFGTVVGPAMAAAAMATLGLAIAFVAWRRRETLARSLGLLVLALALYTAWTLLPLWAAGGADPQSEVPLLPYAGLSFAVIAARFAITRVLRAARELERLNAELRERVAAQEAELRQAAQQMRQVHDTAETADHAKTRFLAAASHDLRQPAHALGLYMATLRAGVLTPEQAEIAQRMSGSLAALDSMFAALLDVSRVDAGAIVPHWDMVALAPLLRRLADEWAPDAEARGLRLALRVCDADAVSVSDALLLERVLRNLLANAVKYTHSGGVLLACRSRTGADGAKAFRIEVWDTGIGIARADQERVFEEFYQAANPGRDRRNGLGLGLAIVRRLVRLLQLRLVLHSRPGRGSVFFIEGLVPAGAVPQKVAAARFELRRLAGTCVAVIEDDAEVRDAMRRLLKLWECEVVAGENAADVLRQLGPAARVHAVVADVRLAEGRRGPDEVRTLFAAWGRSVPLLLVSGETPPGQWPDLNPAAQVCLTKPVSPARLRSWLEQAMQGARAEETSEE